MKAGKSKRTCALLEVVIIAMMVVPAGLASAQPTVMSSAGAGASKVWYLAEGSTGGDAEGSFESFILVANTSSKAAHVRLWHQLEIPCPETGGDWPGADLTVPVGGRVTANVADGLGTGAPGAGHVWSVSTRVESDRPVVAERAMYWTSTAGSYRQTATASLGVTQPAKLWYLAEGSTHRSDEPYVMPGEFETWVLVQNPGNGSARANILYQTEAADVAGPALELAPH